MSAKEDKGDSVLAIQFIAGGVWTHSKMEFFSLSRWVGECIAKYLLHSKSFDLKQLSTTIKSFVTKALEYKAKKQILYALLHVP